MAIFQQLTVGTAADNRVRPLLLYEMGQREHWLLYSFCAVQRRRAVRVQPQREIKFLTRQ